LWSDALYNTRQVGYQLARLVRTMENDASALVTLDGAALDPTTSNHQRVGRFGNLRWRGGGSWLLGPFLSLLARHLSRDRAREHVDMLLKSGVLLPVDKVD
jgi:hypothetical protein